MPIGDQLRAAMAERHARVLLEATRTVETLTIEAAPEDTGYLRSQIRADVQDDQGSLLSSQIIADTDYAGYTDAGTRGPYVIMPTSAKVLVFEAGGGTVFARSVVHPGVRGTQWFTGGEDGGDPMRERWSLALQQAVDGLR